jgi:hypothetical protein
MSFSYSEKGVERKKLMCENFVINTTAQKLLDYEILDYFVNITSENIFDKNVIFRFQIKYEGFENDLLRELDKKPFAIYYGEWGCNPIGGELVYCDSPVLYFSPHYEISPEEIEINVSPEIKTVKFPLKIKLSLDKDVKFNNWNSSLIFRYFILAFQEEDNKFYSCNGTITIDFHGKPMEFYLGDFIGGRMPLKSPWGDYVYGGFPNSVETILPPSIEISNITLSRETDEVIIKFSTNGMMATCGILNKPYCFKDSLILEKEYFILRNKPFGTIKNEFSKDFSSPFVIRANGNNYTLTIPQEIYYGSWYEEMWFKGKLRYENTFYNDVYEEPFILF